MIYALLFTLLFILLLAYFKIADHYNIIDKPNHRSSHTAITIRGGGVVYPFAILLYTIFFQDVSYVLVAGIVMISAVSFWDDVQNLPNKVRLLVHLLSVTALLLSVKAFQEWPLWLLPIVYILVIGTINAYNFMDGINGITGMYSLVILGSLLYVNYYISPFTDSAFIICPVIASLVFLFFNFRKKAKCFAGDVGSVSIGFWIIALLVMVIINTGDLKYVLFLAVYGVDAVLTIIHRLILKQNIFEAHRLHFYQILANDKKVSHLIIASAYGVLQLFINSTIITSSLTIVSFTFAILIPLALIYIIAKPKLMAKSIA
ncbi:glycosyltransferase family 4 protein [Pontibacter sp. KCTC 32443]|uniref:MraY family glycosyltransferase n=1 Tax=Pontibacter TaxID=323449 RepID=UPI00164EC809|nr:MULTISPECIES: glycosyltransferase family 4 protein [Pontibacter]MBC5773014.1 glycosyltransferase family 4 protein [Pontibacter sp. KCTC 32443]